MKGLARWLDYIVYLAVVAYAIAAGPRGSAWVVGLCLCFVGAPLWFVAKRQLAASFSVRAHARQLVTSGLYARLRHPIYVFGGLAVEGVLLALLGWGALGIGAIIVGVEIARARREEHVLAQAFGAEYEAYRRQTWF